nr:reverse transcriptase domain-containing protein [Tanacetum cinerariifolium]
YISYTVKIISGRRVVIGISRPLNRVVTGTTVIITTVMDQKGEVVVTTIAATTTTLATTTGISVMDVTREIGVISPTDLPILQAKGGDAWLITVTWVEFKKLFFLKFFPRAEQERLKREYHTIRQTNTEISTEFMQRFFDLLGSSEQLLVPRRSRRVVIGISRPLSRVVTGTTVLSSLGVPLRATPTQFALRVDADTQESVFELLADKKPGASGRVFAITEDHATKTSDHVLCISTLMKDSVRITHVYRDLPLQFDDKIRAINALPLDMCEFDIILGMDWLTEHHATIDCRSYRVIFGDIHALEFIYHGSLPGKSMQIIFALQARTLLSHG